MATYYINGFLLLLLCLVVICIFFRTVYILTLGTDVSGGTRALWPWKFSKTCEFS